MTKPKAPEHLFAITREQLTEFAEERGGEFWYDSDVWRPKKPRGIDAILHERDFEKDKQQAVRSATWIFERMIERAYREGRKDSQISDSKEHYYDGKETGESELDFHLRKIKWTADNIREDMIANVLKFIAGDLTEFKSFVHDFMAKNDAMECVNLLYERLQKLEEKAEMEWGKTK